MIKIEHTKNELGEIQFTNEWNDPENKYILYIRDGDLTPLISIDDKIRQRGIIFVPYIPQTALPTPTNIKTFDDIIPDFSPYIDKDSVVLFLSYKEAKSYTQQGQRVQGNRENFIFHNSKFYRIYTDTFSSVSLDIMMLDDPDIFAYQSITLIIPSLHSGNIQEINNICKDLKEKHGVERIEVVATHCFIKKSIYSSDIGDIDRFYDSVMITNSVFSLYPIGIHKIGIMRPLQVQVIDCKEFFK